jgi:AcrR family transcriptional regulator
VLVTVLYVKYSLIVARPKAQAARREGIRAAALKALAERGVAGTRLKDIASQAGLTSATILYYYPDMAALLQEVLRQAMDRFYLRRREAISGIADARDRLVAMVMAGLPTGPDDQLASLAWEATSIELRNPMLAEFDRIYVERQIDLYQSVLELGVAQGSFDLAGPARVVATNLVALEDCHGLWLLLGWANSREATAGLILSYASLATGADLAGSADHDTVEVSFSVSPKPGIHSST